MAAIGAPGVCLEWSTTRALAAGATEDEISETRNISSGKAENIRWYRATSRWSDAPVTAGHFRTEAGDEVDLVLERDDGQIIAVEVKAGSRISGEDLRGLRQLKERLGPRLEEAIILHTGGHAYVHDDWVTVLPLDRLWASAEGQTQL